MSCFLAPSRVGVVPGDWALDLASKSGKGDVGETATSTRGGALSGILAKVSTLFCRGSETCELVKSFVMLGLEGNFGGFRFVDSSCTAKVSSVLWEYGLSIVENVLDLEEGGTIGGISTSLKLIKSRAVSMVDGGGGSLKRVSRRSISSLMTTPGMLRDGPRDSVSALRVIRLVAACLGMRSRRCTAGKAVSLHVCLCESHK